MGEGIGKKEVEEWLWIRSRKVVKWGLGIGDRRKVGVAFGVRLKGKWRFRMKIKKDFGIRDRRRFRGKWWQSNWA